MIKLYHIYKLNQDHLSISHLPLIFQSKSIPHYKYIAKKVQIVYSIPMTAITQVLPFIQVILSIILIASILLQQSSAGLGGAMGGSDASATFHTRRGFEKFLFYFTIAIAVLFAGTAVIALFA